METDPPNPEHSEQVPSGTSDDQGPSHQVRSYECTFCRRGFSNAQALGGHMNIHRKDKAKLQKASNESLDIPKTASSYCPISTNMIQQVELNSSKERSTTMRPWILSGEDDVTAKDETGVREFMQLPFFVETPSNTEDRKPGSYVGDNTGKGMSSSHGSSGLELDLELRLGPKPQDDSSAATGTKKLF